MNLTELEKQLAEANLGLKRAEKLYTNWSLGRSLTYYERLGDANPMASSMNYYLKLKEDRDKLVTRVTELTFKIRESK